MLAYQYESTSQVMRHNCRISFLDHDTGRQQVVSCLHTNFKKNHKTFWRASIDAAHFVIASLALSFSVLFLDICQIEECQNYMVQ
jgi:hypothetical protein